MEVAKVIFLKPLVQSLLNYIVHNLTYTII